VELELIGASPCLFCYLQGTSARRVVIDVCRRSLTQNK